MNREMTQRESRFVAVMMLVVVFVAVFFLVEPVWQKYKNNEEEISSLENRLLRFQGISNQYEALSKNQQRLLAEYDAKGLLLKGDTPGLAVADLQSTVRKIVDQAGGRLISTQVINRNNDENRDVSLRVKSEGDIVQIKEILELIENSQVILLADNVSVVKSRRKRFKNKSQNKDQMLQLNFDLTAFVSGVQK